MEKPALSHPDLAAEGQCCDDLWPQFMPQGQPLDLPDTTTNGQVSTNFLDLATQQNPAQVVGFIQSDKSSVAINSSRDLITLNLESRPVFQKARQKQFEFNNITPDYYALTKDAKGPKLRGKAGRRTGSLPLKTAIQAKNIRVLGACLRCRIAKVRVKSHYSEVLLSNSTNVHNSALKILCARHARNQTSTKYV